MSTTQSVPNTEFYEQFMNSLFEIHVDWFLTVCGLTRQAASSAGGKKGCDYGDDGAVLRGRRVLPTVLVALCKECKHQRICYLPSSNATRVSRVRDFPTLGSWKHRFSERPEVGWLASCPILYEDIKQNN